MTAAYHPPGLEGHPAWCPCPACEHRPGLRVRPLTAGDLARLLELDRGPRVGRYRQPTAGRAGGSALAEYHRRRRQEFRAWARQLPARLALAGGLGTASALAASQAAGPGPARLVGAGAALVAGWQLRFRPSVRARAWREGARGEQATARLLKRLERRGWQVVHDLKVPGYRANIDHVAIGPTGVWVVDSKRYRRAIYVGPDGGLWCGGRPMAHTLAMAAWYAHVTSHALGVRARAVVCVHGLGVPYDGVVQDGVTVLPAHQLCRYLATGAPVLDPASIQQLATSLTTSFHPA